MSRLWATGALLTCLVMGSIGCATCGSCGSCGSCGHGTYWRNLGLPGKHPVGKSWCRKCDLCTDVGGPCGLWSQTSTGSVESCTNCGVEEEVYTTSARPRGTVRVTSVPTTHRKW